MQHSDTAIPVRMSLRPHLEKLAMYSDVERLAPEIALCDNHYKAKALLGEQTDELRRNCQGRKLNNSVGMGDNDSGSVPSKRTMATPSEVNQPNKQIMGFKVSSCYKSIVLFKSV
jgi:hypothetical protein